MDSSADEGDYLAGGRCHGKERVRSASCEDPAGDILFRVDDVHSGVEQWGGEPLGHSGTAVTTMIDCAGAPEPPGFCDCFGFVQRDLQR